VSDQLFESMLARLLVEPTFLEACIADPVAATRQYQMDPGLSRAFRSVDFARIRKFSGFIGKIQHNFLWDNFPASRQLLAHHGKELQVFADYRVTQLSTHIKSASRQQKIESFVAFLKRKVPELRIAGLDETLRHEHTMWSLLDASRSQVPCADHVRNDSISSMAWNRMQRLVPQVNGLLRVLWFRCDPKALVAEIESGVFRRHLIEDEHVLAYWLDSMHRQVRILAIDPLTGLFLTKINGVRSLRSIISAIRHGSLSEVKPVAFREIIETIQQNQVIRFDSSDRERSCA